MSWSDQNKVKILSPGKKKQKTKKNKKKHINFKC